MTPNAERRGDWIQTHTGKQFFPLDPHPEDIDIRDIAQALSHLCRYGGHARYFYTVAEHCVHVARCAPSEYRAEALLHDAAEAYLVDVPRPIKGVLGNYLDIERRIERAIALRFGLAHPWPGAVKEIDNRILFDERAVLLGPPPAPWSFELPPLGVRIEGWDPKRARAEFLSEFGRLFPGEVWW